MSWHDFWIAVAGGIGKGGLGKIGAYTIETSTNFVKNRLAKFTSFKSADDLGNENRYYCPRCGTGIEYGRAICLGSKCSAEIIYEATRNELERLFVKRK